MNNLHKKILIIEDDPSFINFMSLLLVRIDTKPRITKDDITHVAYIEEAKVLLLTKQFDLIVCDGSLVDGKFSDLIETFTSLYLKDKVILMSTDLQYWQEIADEAGIEAYEKYDKDTRTIIRNRLIT